MLRKALVGVALAVSAVSSFAAQSFGISTPTSFAFSGDESSLFTFSVAGPATSLFLTTSGSSLSDVLLNGVSFGPISTTPFGGSISFAAPALTAGNYTLTVLTGAGFMNGFDTFSGSVKLTGSTLSTGTASPVPEPETYAMMLAGLGALGFMARRRKQA